RRAVALSVYAETALSGQNVGDAVRKQAERDLDAVLALVEDSVANDEHNAFWEALWLDKLTTVTRCYRMLEVPAEDAYARVDAALAKVAGAKVLQLIYRGNFWVGYGWEARTTAFAPAVPEGGFETLGKCLAIAREAYLEAWELQPGSSEVARGLLTID